jgi:nucleoside phosphorylase
MKPMLPVHPDSPIVFVTALKKESDVLKRLITCKIVRNLSDLQNLSQEQGNIYLLETGIGAKNFGENLDPVIRAIQPDLIINYGICGILNTDKGILQNYLIDKICFTQGQLIKIPQHQLWKDLEKSQGFFIESLLTSDQPVLSISKRTQLLETWGCVLVDMEAYHIAQTAISLNIPLIVTKCTTDFADENTSKTVTSSVNQWQKILREGLKVILHFMMERKT